METGSTKTQRTASPKTLVSPYVIPPGAPPIPHGR